MQMQQLQAAQVAAAACCHCYVQRAHLSGRLQAHFIYDKCQRCGLILLAGHEIMQCGGPQPEATVMQEAEPGDQAGPDAEGPCPSAPLSKGSSP